jgi:hypothetical protein
MAASSRLFQSLTRSKGLVASRQILPAVQKPKTLNKKFVHPFTFEEASASNTTRISTQTSATSATTARPSTPPESKNYATVAHHHGMTAPSSSDKFRVPFDEGPTLDCNIVEQVEAIPEDVEKERGYQIIGKVKAKQDDMLKILAVGDLRVWQ